MKNADRCHRPSGHESENFIFKLRYVLVCVICVIIAVTCLALDSTIFTASPGKKTSSYGKVTVDYSNASQGYIAVKHDASDRKTKLRIVRGNNTDTYDLKTDGQYSYFPLQYGSGTYNVSVYGNVGGDKYAQEFGTEIKVNLTDEFACYICPNQRVWYDEGSSVVALADKLCEGLETDLDKTRACYQWVTKNIKYDYMKAFNVQTGYLPDNEVTLANRSGICYDIASLLCAMLRSQGVYTQLAIGTVNDHNMSVSHSWNLVYINGEWKMLDPTSPGKYSSSAYKLMRTC